MSGHRPSDRPARAAVLALVASVLLLAGCGSSRSELAPGSAEVVTAPQTASTSSSPSSTTTETAEATAALHYAGTITIHSPGTTFSERIEIGQLGYGEEAAPPSEVLEACNADYTTEIASSAYVPMQITMHYSEGRLPVAVKYEPAEAIGNVFDNFALVGLVAMNHDGGWDCGHESEEGSINLLFEASETETAPAWLILQEAISNAEPELRQSVLNETSFRLVPSVQQTSTPRVTISGPDAAECSDTDTRSLLPFARLPFTTTNREGNGSAETCHAAG